MASNIDRLVSLAKSWKRSKHRAEERFMGKWILTGAAKEDYKELEDEEKLRVVRDSMVEFKELAEQAIRVLDSKGRFKVSKRQVDKLLNPTPTVPTLEKEMAELPDSPSLPCIPSAKLPTADEQDLKLYRRLAEGEYWRWK